MSDESGRPARSIRRQGQPVQTEQTRPRARDMSAAGYQSLAAAVLRQAHQDILRAWAMKDRPFAIEVERRIAAIKFLSVESEDLAFWCAVAGLTMGEVTRATRKAHGMRLEAYERLAVKLRREESERSRLGRPRVVVPVVEPMSPAETVVERPRRMRWRGVIGRREPAAPAVH